MPDESSQKMPANELAAVADRVTWTKPETGSLGLRLRGGGSAVRFGAGPEIPLNRKLRFFGCWQESDAYGKSFVIESFTEDAPDDREGIVRYLVEHCDGIGKARAESIVAAYAQEALRSIRTCPAEVAERTGIDCGVVEAAARSLTCDHIRQDSTVALLGLLGGRGFGPAAIEACIKQFGEHAAEWIRRDPWLLLTARIPRAGFRTVDRLYLELGGDPGRLKRQVIAGWHALREGMDGDTWHPESAWNAAIVRQIGQAAGLPERSLQLAKRSAWVKCQKTADGNFWIAEAKKANNESLVAFHLKRLATADAPQWPCPLPPEVSEHQARLWNENAFSPVMILAGTPGTGKTFTAAAVLKILGEKYGHNNIIVCAPTGKAAVRITAALRERHIPLQADTIHQTLGVTRNGHDGNGWGFRYDADDQLPARVAIVDEVSMLDTDLAASLFSALPDGCLLLLVGDPYQLPPVGHGAVLRDCLNAGLPHAELTEIQRNAGAIVRACADIKNGQPFKTCDKINIATGANLKLIECASEKETREILGAILRQMKAGGKYDPFTHVQILTPMNDKSSVSRKPLNVLAQSILNPVLDGEKEEKVKDFRVKDKIICLRNSFLPALKHDAEYFIDTYSAYMPARSPSGSPGEHYVANGDIGQVLALDARAKTLVVRFTAPARTVKVNLAARAKTDDDGDQNMAERFALAYAITIHKSQGSEWPYVIVIADDAAGPIACRELIYTAISRAQDVCLILGKRATIDRQLRVVSIPKRKTFLRELLSHE